MNYTLEYLYKGLTIILAFFYPLLILLMRPPIGSSISAIIGAIVSFVIMASYILYTEILQIKNY